MNHDHMLFTRNEYNIQIQAQVILAGQDLNITVYGGERPHIGSVSIAVPRESMSRDNETSATVSTINLLGHMDDKIGNRFAFEIAVRTNKTCVVCCGIHIDKISQEGIEKVRKLSQQLLEDILNMMSF